MLTKGVNVPRKENVERWLYELLRKQGVNTQQIIYGIEAIGRGEQPDGSGNPLLPDLSKYFYKPGIAGGQTAYFDTRSGGSGILGSTAHTTKGIMYFGSASPRTVIDEANYYLGVGTDTPAARLHLKHATGGGTQTLHPNNNGEEAGSWGTSGGFTRASATASNDGDTSIIQSGDSSNPGLSVEVVMTAPQAASTTGWTLNVVARKTAGTLGVTGRLTLYTNRIFSAGSFSGGSATVIDASFLTNSNLLTTYTTITKSLSAAEASAIMSSTRTTVFLDNTGGTGSTVINITEIYLSGPGALNSTPLIRLSNLSVNSDFNFAASSDSGTDLAYTGTQPLQIAAGTSVASGVRLYSTATAGRIEFGSAASANLLGILSGQAGAVATSIRNATSGFLVSNATVASLISPGALVDFFPTTDTKVLKIRPHSSQSNDIVQVRNNADSSTLASIDSTGKIVAAIGLQLSAQSPATGKIATSSDNNGNFTWSSAATTIMTWPYVAKTGTYTITTSDGIVEATSGTFTLTLPTAVSVAGRLYVIKNGGTGTVTVATTGGQTIDDGSTATLATRYESITLFSDGANWRIM